MTAPIADSIGAITPEWLTQVLQEAGELTGEHVVGISSRPLGTGQMCDSFRLSVTYSASCNAPATLVAKLPAADETSRNAAKLVRAYEKEVRFYQHLAAKLEVAAPRVFHCGLAEDTISFDLILADLAPATQGDQLVGCTVAEAEDAMDQLVALHSPFWDDSRLLKYEWLVGDPDSYRNLMKDLLPMFWSGFQDRYGPSIQPHVLEAGNVLFPQIVTYLAADDSPLTVVHGDFRLDNLLFSPGDRRRLVGVVDWQTVAHGPGPRDVAYFIGAGLHVGDRRRSEESLVRRYYAGLVEAGVSSYSWLQCWDDYRKGAWSGLVMAVAASMLVERTERGDEMFLTMADRHARHALDLKSPIG